MSHWIASNRSMTVDDLKKMLDERGWSVPRLAKESGVPAQTIYRILKGEVAKPQIETMDDLAAALSMKCEATNAPVNMRELVNWYVSLSSGQRAFVLVQLMMYSEPNVRQKALDAADLIDNLIPPEALKSPPDDAPKHDPK